MLGPGEVVTNLAEFMMDAKMHVDQMNELRKDIMELAGRVRAGGRKARRSRDITPWHGIHSELNEHRRFTISLDVTPCVFLTLWPPMLRLWVRA